MQDSISEKSDPRCAKKVAYDGERSKRKEMR